MQLHEVLDLSYIDSVLKRAHDLYLSSYKVSLLNLTLADYLSNSDTDVLRNTGLRYKAYLSSEDKHCGKADKALFKKLDIWSIVWDVLRITYSGYDALNYICVQSNYSVNTLPVFVKMTVYEYLMYIREHPFHSVTVSWNKMCYPIKISSYGQLSGLIKLLVLTAIAKDTKLGLFPIDLYIMKSNYYGIPAVNGNKHVMSVEDFLRSEDNWLGLLNTVSDDILYDVLIVLFGNEVKEDLILTPTPSSYCTEYMKTDRQAIERLLQSAKSVHSPLYYVYTNSSGLVVSSAPYVIDDKGIYLVIPTITSVLIPYSDILIVAVADRYDDGFDICNQITINDARIVIESSSGDSQLTYRPGNYILSSMANDVIADTLVYRKDFSDMKVTLTYTLGYNSYSITLKTKDKPFMHNNEGYRQLLEASILLGHDYMLEAIQEGVPFDKFYLDKVNLRLAAKRCH